MSAGLAVQIGYLSDKYTDLGTHLSNARDSLIAAGAALSIHNYGNAGYFLDKAGDHLGDASDDVFGAADGIIKWNIYLWEWVDANWPEDGDVDMDAILNAMLRADFSELQKFVGLVDAYRVAIWNAPFNSQFYAALARGFQMWPQG